MKQHLHLHWKVNTDQTFVLNLDKNFNPYTDDRPLFFLKHKAHTFLGGERHIQIDTSDIPDFPMVSDKRLVITQRADTISDVFDVVLAVDAARRLGFKHIELVLPYFPAARQDRVCNTGEPLTLKVYTDMINGCGFEAVYIFTPHSEVTPALLNNVVVIDELAYAEMVINDIICKEPFLPKSFNIVCPDAGAGKRTLKIVSYLANVFRGCEFNLIRCEKIRDVRDGSLKEFFVQADDLDGFPTIIFDDILSMGGTFIGLGEVLKSKNCGLLMLFTAHADCQKGIEKMVNYFDWYYTTNSRKHPDYGYDNFTMFDFSV
jgi:ribose-phosphate pyrophosphokinase